MPVPRITRDELKARLDAGNPPVIFDARLKYPYEHSTVRLPGAVRISPDGKDLPAVAHGSEIVVYDSDPGDIVSAPIVGMLLDQGFTASVLKGGIAEWMAASFPTEPKGGAASPAPVA